MGEADSGAENGDRPGVGSIGGAVVPGAMGMDPIQDACRDEKVSSDATDKDAARPGGDLPTDAAGVDGVEDRCCHVAAGAEMVENGVDCDSDTLNGIGTLSILEWDRDMGGEQPGEDRCRRNNGFVLYGNGVEPVRHGPSNDGHDMALHHGISGDAAGPRLEGGHRHRGAHL